MGIEGRDKAKALEAGAVALSGQLGKTVQRLRKAYNLSLSELSEQSGVAKSIISQIERNETNPTLATIWRLAQALDVSIERVLQAADDEPFIEKSTKGETPMLVSDDGKCKLGIIGWIKTVEWLQWYDEIKTEKEVGLDGEIQQQRGAVILARNGGQGGGIDKEPRRRKGYERKRQSTDAPMHEYCMCRCSGGDTYFFRRAQLHS